MMNARVLADRLSELLSREHAAMADFLVDLAEFDRRRRWEEHLVRRPLPIDDGRGDVAGVRRNRDRVDVGERNRRSGPSSFEPRE